MLIGHFIDLVTGQLIGLLIGHFIGLLIGHFIGFRVFFLHYFLLTRKIIIVVNEIGVMSSNPR